MRRTDPRAVHIRLGRVAGRLCLVSLLSAAPLVSAGGDPSRGAEVVVLVGPRAVYRVAAASAIAALSDAQVRVVRHELRSADQLEQVLQRLRGQRPDVIVTTGSSLTEAVLEAVPDVPVVFLVVPNVADASFLGPDSPHRGRVVGVTSDIDPAEQVRWIRKLTPRCGRLGLLYSGSTARTAGKLSEAARAEGLELRLVRTTRAQFAEAIRELEQSDACGVLMVPDAGVYEAGTVRALLLWGLKKHKAVWTFSEKLVESGALGGLYADPKQIGERGAELVRRVLADGAVKRPGFYYPAARVAVNVRTARLIDWRLAPDALAANVTRFPRREGARP